MWVGAVRSQKTDSVHQRGKGIYTVEASISGGPMVSYFREPRSPVSAHAAVIGGSVLARIMWHPSRLISFGLASGYTMFSQEDFTFIRPLLIDTVVPGSAKITAIPLQIAASMQKGGFEGGVAVGPYIMMIDIVDEDITHATRLELGITSFASYKWQLNDRLFIGPQLRCISMGYHGILSFVAECRIQYDIIQY